MRTPQGGIFALGTASDAHHEFDAVPARAQELVRAVAALREPRTTMGGFVMPATPHDAVLWLSGSAEVLADADQEQVIGRTKPDSVELDDKPDDSHVAATDQERFGHIFRMFVGFSSEQSRLVAMLESMAGTPDALTRYTHPLTGAYYFVPSTESLRALTG